VNTRCWVAHPPHTHTTQAQRSCVNESLVSATKVAAGTGAVAAGAVVAALKASASFRNSLGTSGRTALVVMPAMAAFFLDIEWHINECAHRARYGAAAKRERGVEPGDILPQRRA